MAKSHLNVGVAYDSQGRYEEAPFQYQNALEAFLDVYGQEHRTWPRRTII